MRESRTFELSRPLLAWSDAVSPTPTRPCTLASTRAHTRRFHASPAYAGDDVFLHRAEALGAHLLDTGAFDSPSGLPFGTLTLECGVDDDGDGGGDYDACASGNDEDEDDDEDDGAVQPVGRREATARVEDGGARGAEEDDSGGGGGATSVGLDAAVAANLSAVLGLDGGEGTGVAVNATVDVDDDSDIVDSDADDGSGNSAALPSTAPAATSTPAASAEGGAAPAPAMSAPVKEGDAAPPPRGAAVPPAAHHGRADLPGPGRHGPRGTAHNPAWAGGVSSVSEVATLSVEFAALSARSGDGRFRAVARRVHRHLEALAPPLGVREVACGQNRRR